MIFIVVGAVWLSVLVPLEARAARRRTQVEQTAVLLDRLIAQIEAAAGAATEYPTKLSEVNAALKADTAVDAWGRAILFFPWKPESPYFAVMSAGADGFVGNDDDVSRVSRMWPDTPPARERSPANWITENWWPGGTP